MPAASPSATICVTCRTRTSSGPSVGSSSGPRSLPRAPSGSYHMSRVKSGAPVRIASSAGPAGIRVGAPKKVTGTPRRDRSRSASSGTKAPSRNRSASTSMGGRTAPVVGRISMPMLSRNATKRRYSPSGRRRSATVVIFQPRAATQAPAAS